MKTTKTKKVNISWLQSNKKMFCIISVTVGLLLAFNCALKAQTNTAYGTDALKSITTGAYNTAFGYEALYSNTTGIANTANGSQALYSNTTGSYNTANGLLALYSNNTGTSNTALGHYANVAFGNLTNATAIGASASVMASNTIQLGDDAVTKVYAGVGKTATVVTGGLQITGGSPAAGKVLTSDASGTATWQTITAVTSITGNIPISVIGGTTAPIISISKANRFTDGYLSSTDWNTFYSKGNGSVTSVIVAMGLPLSVANPTTTPIISMNGTWSDLQVADNLTINGGTINNSIIGGTTPAAGTFTTLKVTDGLPAVGKVLTSDANGLASWQAPSTGNNWSLTGNKETKDGVNFIGTTDINPFNIRVNNEKAGRIDANNAFYGYQSGNARTTGGFNTAMGFQSLYANTTGDGNTAIGREAMKQNNTGNNNTAIGSLALSSNAEGSFNTAIGYNADVNDKLTNATALGHAAWVDASNKVAIGNTGVMTIGGYANWSNLSDARFKKNIQQDVHGLDFITKLNPITYSLDIKKLNSFLGVDERNAKRQQQPSPQKAQAIATKEAIRYTGFLAQEVEQAAQAVNYNFSGVIKPTSDKGHYSMSYSDFVVPLVKAVQEQQQMLEAKDAEIKAVKEDLQKVNQQLQQQIDELKKLIVENSSLTKDVATKQVGTSNAEDISLYPNPTTGIFTITASHIDNGVIEIYDMAGNSLQKTTFNNAKSGYQLNVSGYAKGVYLLNIIANNKKYTKRLVIQ